LSYVSLHKSQLLDSLENQVLYADLTSIIVGRKGIGKSFFLNQLLLRLDGQVYVSQIEATSVLTPTQLEKSISLQLGLSWQETDKSLLEQISTNLSQRILLIIDDAHLLSLDCLESLLSLVNLSETNNQNPVYLVLAGESNLANKLNETLALSQNPNLCVVFELQPVEVSETKNLFADFQSLQVDKIETLYDEQKLNNFWQLSHVIPGDLEFQLNRWLKEIKINNEVKIKEIDRLDDTAHSLPKKQYLLAVGYILLACILVLALIYQDEINGVITPNEEFSIKTPDSSDYLESQESKVNTTSQVNSNELLNDKDEFITGLTSSKVVNNKENNEQVKSENNIENLVASDEAKASLIEININDGNKSGNIQQQENEVVENFQNFDKTLEQIKFSQQEKKLLAMRDSLFTLQWMGVSSLKAAQKVRDNHPLKESMLIYRRVHKDNYLYLIVGGFYNNHVEADNAKAIYAQRGYPGSPWIKSIETVKQEVNTLN